MTISNQNRGFAAQFLATPQATAFTTPVTGWNETLQTPFGVAKTPRVLVAGTPVFTDGGQVAQGRRILGNPERPPVEPAQPSSPGFQAPLTDAQIWQNTLQEAADYPRITKNIKRPVITSQELQTGLEFLDKLAGNKDGRTTKNEAKNAFKRLEEDPNQRPVDKKQKAVLDFIKENEGHFWHWADHKGESPAKLPKGPDGQAGISVGDLRAKRFPQEQGETAYFFSMPNTLRPLFDDIKYKP